MLDLKKRKLDNSVWIALRSEKKLQNSIEFGNVGYQEEFIGSGSLMIPTATKAFSKELSWMDIGIRPIHNSSFRNNVYIPSDVYQHNDGEGLNLVLNQSFDNNHDLNEWHLHQDLVISLGLKREADIWVCPQEGYIEVAKLERDEEGSPISLVIRNQFLKDYLCARSAGLYVSSYYSRDYISGMPQLFLGGKNPDDRSRGKTLGSAEPYRCTKVMVFFSGRKSLFLT